MLLTFANIRKSTNQQTCYLHLLAKNFFISFIHPKYLDSIELSILHIITAASHFLKKDDLNKTTSIMDSHLSIALRIIESNNLQSTLARCLSVGCVPIQVSSFQVRNFVSPSLTIDGRHRMTI